MKSEKKLKIFKLLGFFQKYFGQKIKIKSSVLKKYHFLIFFLFVIRVIKLLKLEIIKLIIREIISKNLFSIFFIYFILI